ncbi:MAG TPA: hypothetical protein DCY13_13610 [Verrucomicrobiales bacterium]|nr:hypothetical protein [Verrucomicrobiales bacterium]
MHHRSVNAKLFTGARPDSGWQMKPLVRSGLELLRRLIGPISGRNLRCRFSPKQATSGLCLKQYKNIPQPPMSRAESS